MRISVIAHISQQPLVDFLVIGIGIFKRFTLYLNEEDKRGE